MFRLRVRVTTVVGVFCQVASVSIVANAQRPSAKLDTGIVAIVARIVSDSTRLPVVVDTQPLPPEMEVPRRDDPLLEMVGDIVGVALRSENTSVRKACSGTLMPSLNEGKKGCPKTAHMLIVVGTLANRGPHCNSPKACDWMDQKHDKYWTVRVLKSYLGPGGFNVEMCDYVFEKRGDELTFVKPVGLLIIE
jgi:hypothetical protein